MLGSSANSPQQVMTCLDPGTSLELCHRLSQVVGSRPSDTLTSTSMGKLNIAHHKSYHPYRLDNIERVRRDEAAAKRKQTEDADRALVAVRLLSPLALRDDNSFIGCRIPSEHASGSCRYHPTHLSSTRYGWRCRGTCRLRI